MQLTVYGDAEQRKLAKYPERFKEVQQLQSTIPNIEDLNLDDTTDLQRRLHRFAMELITYKVSIVAVIKNYERVIGEAKGDCEEMRQTIAHAPAGTKEDRILSMNTSIVQTEQQILAFENQCKILREQISTIDSSKMAIRIAQEQNQLAELTTLYAALRRQDSKLRTQ